MQLTTFYNRKISWIYVTTNESIFANLPKLAHLMSQTSFENNVNNKCLFLLRRADISEDFFECFPELGVEYSINDGIKDGIYVA